MESFEFTAGRVRYLRVLARRVITTIHYRMPSSSHLGCANEIEIKPARYSRGIFPKLIMLLLSENYVSREVFLFDVKLEVAYLKLYLVSVR